MACFGYLGRSGGRGGRQHEKRDSVTRHRVAFLMFGQRRGERRVMTRETRHRVAFLVFGWWRRGGRVKGMGRIVAEARKRGAYGVFSRFALGTREGGEIPKTRNALIWGVFLVFDMWQAESRQHEKHDAKSRFSCLVDGGREGREMTGTWRAQKGPGGGVL